MKRTNKSIKQAADTPSSAPQRIQKLLAQAGIGSRRQIEAWIQEGRIQINGQAAQLGQQANVHDRIKVDGRIVKLDRLISERVQVIMYHKPVGEITTRNDPQKRPTVFDNLPKLRRGRWISIGRLDINTCGLLLLTNNGELAHRLMHPSSGIEREYAVRILGEVTEEMFKNLQNGVELEDGPACFGQIWDAGGQGANHWYHVVLHEGRHREVRRLWETQGVKVSRLIRVRFGPISLPRLLKPGKFRDLEDSELQALCQSVGFEIR